MLRFSTGKIFSSISQYYCTSKLCWKCDNVLSQSKVNLFCEKCQFIQNLDKSIDYFKLFGIDACSYKIDQKELAKQFHQLQNRMHPDRYVNRSAEEQRISAETSTVINEAFKTLKSDLRRAWYLLKIKSDNQITPSSASSNTKSTDLTFLDEMLEWNEKIDNLTNSEDLEKYSDLIRNKMDILFGDIQKAFDQTRLGDVQSALLQLNYWDNLFNRLKNQK